MDINSVLLIFPKKFVENTLYLAVSIAKSLNTDLKILILEREEETKRDKIESILNSENIEYDIFIEKNGLKSKATKFIENYHPDLLIIPHEKIDPMVHIFKHPEAEKFVEKFEDASIIFAIESSREIKKPIIYIDPNQDSVEYVKRAYNILKKICGNVEFIYSFHEEFYEYSLSKTHPDAEARSIINELYEEGLRKSKELIAKAVGKEVTLKVIKGDPKKEVPFFAHQNGYDILSVNIENEDKKSFIENSQITIGLFKG